MKATNFHEEELFCELSDEEYRAFAIRLSGKWLQYEDVEEAKAEAAKDFKEQLTAIRGDLKALADVIRRRGETRAVRVAIQYHSPKQGEKTFVRIDTGEELRVEAMTAEELQDKLFMEEQADLPIAAPPPSTGMGYEERPNE